MSEDSTKKTVLPLSMDASGDMHALVADEAGIRPITYTPVGDDEAVPGTEVVTFTPHGGGSTLFDAHYFRLSGPPQVATPAYCSGWDRIFGKKQDVGEA